MAENNEAERAAFEAWARDTDQGYASLKGTDAPGHWYYFEDDAQAAWAAWQAARSTPSASIGEDGLPELPKPVGHVVSEYVGCGIRCGVASWARSAPKDGVDLFTADQMRQYARDAVAADRRAREESPQAAQGVKTWQELVHAADAVVERWHSRDWKQPHTAEFINRLAEAVGALKFAAPPLSSEQQVEKGEGACGS
jgi:hypothetical protein